MQIDPYERNVFDYKDGPASRKTALVKRGNLRWLFVLFVQEIAEVDEWTEAC